MTWLSARLVLSLPATIAQGAIRVMKVWPLSDKNGWQIAATLVLAGLPIIILELGLYEVISAGLGHRILEVAHLLGEDNAAAPGMARMREYSLWMGLSPPSTSRSFPASTPISTRTGCGRWRRNSRGGTRWARIPLASQRERRMIGSHP